MVALPNTYSRMTPEEFFAWEKNQEIRYEYVNGDVIAMAGGTIAHNDLAVSLLLRLAPHVKSRGCRINVADVKVQIRQRYRYPDLVVTCDDRDKRAINLFQYPKVIVEVMSPSTESTDRGKKWREYQSIDTLQEYVLISPNEPIIEVYRRRLDDVWEYVTYEPGSQFHLESLEFTCSVEEIYESVVLDKLIEEPFDI
ncbi:MAG: Uma2 family endonuclease [Alkalinema sp. CAN_BIN05]|nr:Uma2 family endonuclease [Alkalinema sp. CAN_BIN05]